MRHDAAWHRADLISTFPCAARVRNKHNEGSASRPFHPGPLDGIRTFRIMHTSELRYAEIKLLHHLITYVNDCIAMIKQPRLRSLAVAASPSQPRRRSLAVAASPSSCARGRLRRRTRLPARLGQRLAMLGRRCRLRSATATRTWR